MNTVDEMFISQNVPQYDFFTLQKDSRGAFQRVLIVLGLLESMSEVLEPVFIQMKNFQRKIVMRTSSVESQ